ncbi:MAG: CopD family protein [Nitrospiraceae bacterium]|nr:CopD family protein [Nitrospiraceae bacterium]
MTRPTSATTLAVTTAILVLLFFAAPLSATPDYARQTGKECGYCHVDTVGGGALTPEGEHFFSELKTKGQARKLSTPQHVIRLLVGYLHMMAAVVWFGTIMYVHILLKPAYASKGLPRGELRLGWLSMIVIAVTGILLTVARVPNLATFTTTKFGILLAVKIALFLVMVASALITTIYIGPRLRKKLKSPVAALLSHEITPEQLSHFDGKEGRPAYFAYKGLVYDATASRLWKNGAHMVKHHAGSDLTGALSLAPHKEDKVLALPQIGMLVTEGHKPKRPFHERLFYFFAYMNLALVFVIIFVISLWRWW